MTLDARILKKLGDWQPAYGRRQMTVTDDAGSTITFTLERRDELSCLLWEISFVRKQTAAGETLRTFAERVGKNLSAVLEPIKVLEIDEQRQEGILRSTTPHTLNDAALHYDVLVNGTKSALLRRYKTPASKPGKREQTAFALTTEGLVRLLTAFASDR